MFVYRIINRIFFNKTTSNNVKIYKLLFYIIITDILYTSIIKKLIILNNLKYNIVIVSLDNINF